jgi:hypothetical protein
LFGRQRFGIPEWSKQLFDVVQMRTVRYPLPEGNITEADPRAGFSAMHSTRWVIVLAGKSALKARHSFLSRKAPLPRKGTSTQNNEAAN